MIINGSDLMLFAKQGSVAKSIACATSHSLEISLDTKDISTKDNGHGIWADSEASTLSYTISSENMMTEQYNTLFDMMVARQKIDITFGLQGNLTNLDAKDETTFTAPDGGWTPDAENNYKGKALITSLNITAQNGEKATVSISLTGCGALTKIGDGIKVPN